ncbi:MAG TPA: type II toxin-antitoxin system RelE/ParE family toxin, partial [Dehalococcoidia bacterium]|nr:type II toxin-antitoxin system RelE/ParE family toxin [Dehalococcoidia bacterium]
MEVTFGDDDLERLEREASFTGGWPPAVVASFRRKIQAIRAATDERDFYALKSLRYEKLKGARSHQRSMRLNNQYRLVVQVTGQSESRIVHIKGIED